MSDGSSSLVMTALRTADRDRYLAMLVLPAEVREAVASLFAFNAEIASVRERAHNPAAGEIRLQWWADALTGPGHGEVRQNPIADALLRTIETYRLPVAPLSKAIAARRFDLYQDAMPDMTSFEGYAGETVSTLLQLAAMIVNGGAPVETGDAAGHLGVAQALTGHLRAFGHNASQGRIFLPMRVFAAHGVSEADILTGKASGELAAALGALADMARDHAAKAEAAIAALPSALRPVFAPVALVGPHLRGVDVTAPFQAPAELPDLQKIARLAWWALRRR